MESLMENFFRFTLGYLIRQQATQMKACHSDAEDGQEGSLAAHVVLHLDSHIGTHRHTDGNRKGKPADSLSDLGYGQDVPCQSHGGRSADRVDGAHIQADYNQ